MSRTKLCLGVALLFLLAFVPLGMGMRQEKINKETPLETFVAGGHQWDVVHSKLCKCHE